jgi:hypothetical protein
MAVQAVQAAVDWSQSRIAEIMRVSAIAFLVSLLAVQGSAQDFSDAHANVSP